MTFSEAVWSVLVSLVQRWRLLFATDVLFKAVAFLLLTPLAAGVLHLSLWIAGSGTLADADIRVDSTYGRWDPLAGSVVAN